MAIVRRTSPDKRIAGAWGLLFTAILAGLIVIGSRNLNHFDAALVGYTFATLFATFGITYRYAMWLRRPPTRMYWKRGWSVFLTPKFVGSNLAEALRRFFLAFAANRFIFRRGRLRGTAHWLMMWGCLLAAAITFPLVWGWIHFESVPGHLDWYQTFVFGFPVNTFRIESVFAFVVFHGLVWSAILVIAGVMLAFRRRMVDHAAVTLQSFAQDVMPLVLLFAISVSGLMLTASYTWMKGYGYDFLAILHAITVIVTLLYLPFGKLFHVFQRPAQIGVSFYKDAGTRGEQAMCGRCGRAFASSMMVRDLAIVERQLGFSYELEHGAEHYQQICPRCRRALFGLAQASAWSERLTERVSTTAR
jgi:nitrate reductase gamma subunit